ncbi:MAG TPA: hypothetical protein VGO03_16410, partial [Acidimicrobiia bacterium]
MSASIALRVQSLDHTDQALVLARLAEGRESTREFSASALLDLFYEAGLPPPARIHNVLAALERRDLATRGRARGDWRLTPSGRARSLELVTDLDLVALNAEIESTGVSHLGQIAHALVPPSLAPPSLVTPLARFLESHPFELNVFGMTRFPDESDDA